MNCERIREQIPEVLAGRLDKAAREKLEEHLEGCAGCRAEVAELNAVWRGLETLKAESDGAPQAAAKARPLSRGVEPWRELVCQRRPRDAAVRVAQGARQEVQPEEREYLAIE